jgi:hypothetical protein
MGCHRNARLGLAGRRQLVADVDAGLLCRQAAKTLRRLTDDSVWVVAALVGGAA